MHRELPALMIDIVTINSTYNDATVTICEAVGKDRQVYASSQFSSSCHDRLTALGNLVRAVHLQMDQHRPGYHFITRITK